MDTFEFYLVSGEYTFLALMKWLLLIIWATGMLASVMISLGSLLKLEEFLATGTSWRESFDGYRYLTWAFCSFAVALLALSIGLFLQGGLINLAAAMAAFLLWCSWLLWRVGQGCWHWYSR